MGLEGIVSKKADGAISRRAASWLKVKCRQSDDFVIVGFGASEAAGGIGALLLAEPDDGGLRYVGRVGTGFPCPR